MSEEKATEVQVEETAAEDITTDSDGASEPALSLAASAAAPTAPAYSPVAWKNGKENGTKANADNFNHMDSQIEQLTSVINAQAALIDTLQTNIAALQESASRTVMENVQTVRFGISKQNAKTAYLYFLNADNSGYVLSMSTATGTLTIADVDAKGAWSNRHDFSAK